MHMSLQASNDAEKRLMTSINKKHGALIMALILVSTEVLLP